LIGVKGQQLVHHVTDQQLIPPWQCGDFPGREAHTPVLMEELMWDITRTSRRPLLQMDFDASSCYDRIIPSIASLASRSYGQHRLLGFIHSQFLRNAQFLLKTKMGLLTESYSHCAEYFISTKLIETQEAAASRAVFTSPDMT
jgi:hypothetical protein